MIENLKWLLNWYNLIFALAFVWLLIYCFLVITGVMGGDADHDVSHDHDHDGVGGHDGSTGMLWGFQSFLGVGKVPLSIITVAFSALWGISGLVTNLLIKPKVEVNETWALLSIGVAALVAFFGTHFFTAAMAKLVPSKESYVSTSKSFVGLSGIVQFDVTDTAGTVRVYDAHSNLQDLECRVYSDQAPIKRGATVTLVENISGTSHFFVKLASGKAS